MKAVFFLFATIVITGMAADVHRFKVDSNGNKVEVPPRNNTHHAANPPHHAGDPPHHAGDPPHHSGNSSVHRFIIDKNGNREVAYQIPDIETTTVTEPPKHKKKGLGGLLGGVVKDVGGVVKGVGGVVDDLGAAL